MSACAKYNKETKTVLTTFGTTKVKSAKTTIKLKKDYDFMFKLVLVGSSRVGKSNLLLRFADDSFTDSYIATIGVDFRFKTMNVPTSVLFGSKINIVKLQIWDTAGAERFRTITSAYYRGAHAIVLCYDTTNHDTLTEIAETWFPEVQKHGGEVPLFLVGTKCDLKDERKCSVQEAQEMAKRMGAVSFMGCSAKNATNVEQMFLRVAKECILLKEHQ